jgi:hypothetical protein
MKWFSPLKIWTWIIFFILRHGNPAGGPLQRQRTTRVWFSTLPDITGGAPLLALFEKGPAAPPTSFDSALHSRRSDFHLKRSHSFALNFREKREKDGAPSP